MEGIIGSSRKGSTFSASSADADSTVASMHRTNQVDTAFLALLSALALQQPALLLVRSPFVKAQGSVLPKQLQQWDLCTI